MNRAPILSVGSVVIVRHSCARVCNGRGHLSQDRVGLRREVRSSKVGQLIVGNFDFAFARNFHEHEIAASFVSRYYIERRLS